MIRKVKVTPKLSVPKLAVKMKQESLSVTSSCIQKILRKEGYRGCRAKKNPLISKKNKLKKLTFARDHVTKPQEFWDRVLWSDESKFNVFGSDGRRIVWRMTLESLKEKNINPTVEGGRRSLLVWACMSSSGVGNIQFIDDIIDKNVYLDILKRNVKESARKLGIQRHFLFQKTMTPSIPQRFVTIISKKKKSDAWNGLPKVRI